MYVRKWNTWIRDPRTGPRFSAFYWSKCGSSFLFSRYGSGAISGSLIWTLLPSRQCRPKQFHWALVVCSFLTSLGRLLEIHEILNNNVFDLKQFCLRVGANCVGAILKDSLSLSLSKSDDFDQLCEKILESQMVCSNDVFTYDEKNGSKECDFTFHIEVFRKSYSEIISIGECFFLKSRPFLCYSSNFCSVIC